MHHFKKVLRETGQILVFSFGLLPILIIIRVLIALLIVLPLGSVYTYLLHIDPDQIATPLFWATQGAAIAVVIYYMPERYRRVCLIASVIAFIASLGFGPLGPMS